MLSYRPGDLSSALGGEGEEEALISSLFSSPYEVGPRAEYSAANKGSGTPPESRPPGRKPRKKRKEPSTGGAVLPEEEAVDEKEARTIFVGNLPVGMRADRIKRLFKAYGTVESVRLRSVAVEGTKVGDHGNQNLVRKVCIMQKKIRADVKDSTNAYVVFETAEAASAAKEQGNGTEVEGRHIRVDSASPTIDPSLSVFVGNIPFDTQDEELWQHFACHMEGDEASGVRGVRLVRDKDTLVGKGFGFVLLVNKASVGAALHLHQKPFKGRPLRVTVCGKRTKGRRGSAKPAQDEQNISSFEGRRAEGATRRLAGKGRLPEKKKKRKRPK